MHFMKYIVDGKFKLYTIAAGFKGKSTKPNTFNVKNVYLYLKYGQSV